MSETETGSDPPRLRICQLVAYYHPFESGAELDTIRFVVGVREGF